MPLRGVQEPARRQRVRADGVEAVGRHLREVTLDHIGAGVGGAILGGPEGAVRDAADIQLLRADKEEFALHAGTGYDTRRRRLMGVVQHGHRATSSSQHACAMCLLISSPPLAYLFLAPAL